MVLHRWTHLFLWLRKLILTDVVIRWPPLKSSFRHCPCCKQSLTK
jgi:hypothetical protein